MADRQGYQPVQRGIGQDIFNKWLHVGLEMYGHAFAYAAVAYISILIVVYYTFGNLSDFGFAMKGIYTGILSQFVPDYLLTYKGEEYPAIKMYHAYREAGIWKILIKHGMLSIFTLPVFVSIFILMLRIYGKEAEDFSKLKHLGGTELKTPDEVNHRIKELNKQQPDRRHTPTIPLTDEISLTYCNETYGTLIVGAPGSGKTVVISNALDWLETQPQYRKIVYTYKGDFIERFYRPERGDIIFNAFDVRTLRLNVFDLVHNQTDFLKIASVLIPEPKGNADPFWSTAARDVFAAMLNYCWMMNKRTNADVWEVLTWTQDQILKEIAPVFGSEETKKYFSDSKLASNISAVIAGYTTIFKFLPKETDKFNMEEFLEGRKGSGWIFISNMDNLSYMLRPWITLFIDSLISTHLSLPDDYNRRVVYELDEFNTLHGTIGESIHKLAIAGRSKGAIPIIGYQGQGGLEKTLGREQARDVTNAMGNSIFLRVGQDPDTAKWMSDVIGETMFFESEISHSSKTGEGSDGTNIRSVRKTEKLVLPSDLMNMPSLQGYIKLAEYGTVKADFRYKTRKVNNQGFIPRPDIDYSSLVAASQAALAKANNALVQEVPDSV